MIARIQGKIVQKFANSLIVDVRGVGYEIQVPQGDYERLLLHEDVTLHIYHHIREQSQDLFGFSSISAKKLFELLTTVQGIGPKAALSILGLGESEVVRNAIANQDAAFIAKANGVGKKSADRVIVDLSDKVGMPLRYDNTNLGVSEPILHHTDEALEALMALGYTLSDASKALEGVSTELSTAERVTQARKH